MIIAGFDAFRMPLGGDEAAAVPPAKPQAEADVITETAIKDALKTGRARIELTDPGPRGEGRLTLQVRRTPKRTIAEWYAVWHRAGQRRSAKLGTYPSLSLSEARRQFRETASVAIAAGDEPLGKGKRAASGASVKDLFEAYIRHLEVNGKNAAGPRKYLLGSTEPSTGRWKGHVTSSAVAAIDPRKPAREVSHVDIIPHLREIRERGAISAAAHARAYISAAFTFAIQSTNAYHRPAGSVAWGVERNPVSAIPFDPSAKRVGSRHLSAGEVRTFWRWLEDQRTRSHAATVLLLCLATGQRLSEVTCLTPKSELADAYGKVGIRLGWYDAEKGWIYWAKTKNGTAHALPLPAQAIALLDSTSTTASGLYFPHRRDTMRPQTISAAEQLVRRYLDEDGSRLPFTPRDLRRTWKTLAGEVGLSKEIRDRLQNHALSDVSSRHYDRWSYAPEKMAAMEAWSVALGKVLLGKQVR